MKDRAYSFRASEELGDQVEGALAFLRSGTPDDVEMLTATWLRLLLQQGAEGNRSAAFREVLETLGRAWAKIIDDRSYIPAYKAWAEEDTEGPAWRDAVARLTAQQWSDDE